MSTQPKVKKSVPVMGQKYSIEYYDNIKTDDKEDVYGDTDKGKKRIRIDLSNNKSQSLVRSTLLHEVLHAILSQSGLDNLLTDEVEEAIVVAIEHGLFPLVEFRPSIWERIRPKSKLELEIDEE